MTTTLTVKAADLATALTMVEPFASRDEIVPSVCVVRFIPKPEGVVLAATNRYALAEYTLPHEASANGNSTALEPFSLPYLAAKDWLQRVKPRNRASWPVTVTVDDGKATLQVQDETSTFPTQQAAWIPNHQQLFPAATGEHPVIGIAPRILTIFTKVFGKQNAVLRFAFGPKPTSAVTVTCAAVPEFRGLLMPCDLHEEGA